jgi:hypothetical protein
MASGQAGKPALSEVEGMPALLFRTYLLSASLSGWPALFNVTWSLEIAPLFGTGGVWACGSGLGSEGGCAAWRTSGGTLLIGVIMVWSSEE